MVNDFKHIGERLRVLASVLPRQGPVLPGDAALLRQAADACVHLSRLRQFILDSCLEDQADPDHVADELILLLGLPRR